MKKRTITLLSAIALATGLAMAAPEDKTIKGEAQCAKCQLKEGMPQCQTAIQVNEGAKVTTYYLVSNKVTKELDGQVCSGKKRVTATGTVKQVNGKLEMTPSKVDIGG